MHACARHVRIRDRARDRDKERCRPVCLSVSARMRSIRLRERVRALVLLHLQTTHYCSADCMSLRRLYTHTYVCTWIHSRYYSSADCIYMCIHRVRMCTHSYNPVPEERTQRVVNLGHVFNSGHGAHRVTPVSEHAPSRKTHTHACWDLLEQQST